MLNGGLASGGATFITAIFMGWRVTNPGSTNVRAVNLTQAWSWNHPGRRLRPSHMASVPTKTNYWAGHYTRWADDQRVPIPMRRGIPCAGDVLGSGGFGIQAIAGS